MTAPGGERELSEGPNLPIRHENGDLVGSETNLPARPIDVLVARFQVQRLIPLGIQGLMWLTTSSARAEGYMNLARVAIRGRVPSQLFLDRAYQETNFVKAQVAEEVRIEQIQKATNLMFKLAELSVESQSPGVGEVINGLFQHINNYDSRLSDEAFQKRLKEYGGLGSAGIIQAKIEDLARLAIFSLHSKLETEYTQRVIQDLEGVVGSDNTIRVLEKSEYIGVLNQLLRVYVVNGDLTAAQRVAGQIEAVNTDPKRGLDKNAERFQAEATAVQKLAGIEIASQAFSRFPDASGEKFDLTTEQIVEILSSNNMEAIKALAFLGIIDYDTIAQLGINPPQLALESLIEGQSLRLLFINQVAQEQQKALEGRLANLKQTREKETLINPLVELDSFLAELEAQLPEELQGQKRDIYIGRLALRERQRSLKEAVAKEAARIQVLNQSERSDSIIQRVTNTQPYSKVVDGYCHTVVLRTSITGEDKKIFESLVVDLMVKRMGQGKEGIERDIFISYMRNILPGVNLKKLYNIYSILTYHIGWNQQALRQMIEADPLPEIEWKGDPIEHWRSDLERNLAP